jgi:hypothetical protein
MRDVMLAGNTVDTVSVAGNFQAAVIDSNWTDWTPGITLLSDPDNDSIFTATFKTLVGNYEYKFINGTAWADEEIVPTACAVNSNRSLSINAQNGDTVQVGPFCFSSCNPCAPLPVYRTVQFDVDMRDVILAGAFNNVTLAGSFQDEVIDSNWTDWTPGITNMTDTDNDSVFSITLSIPDGFYEYKFINGNSFADEETVPNACVYNTNRFITINSDTIIGTVCFSSCIACPALPDTIYAIFKVDMKQELQNGTYNGATLTGNFMDDVVGQNLIDWTPGIINLTDNNNDSIYETILAVYEGEYEYKFINGNSWGQDETVPSNCAFNQNRLVNLLANSGDTIIVGPFCFGSCDTMCPIILNLNEAVDSDIVSVWPNPSTEDFYLEVNNKEMNFDVNILNITGKSCRYINNLEGYSTHRISTKELNKGLYFIHLKTDDGRLYIKKMILE